MAPDVKNYTTATTKTAQFRLHVYFAYGRNLYSNSLTIKAAAEAPKPQLYTNIIHTNNLQVSSPTAYNYIITDVNGQQVQKGQIKEGETSIQTGFLRTGIYIIQFQKDGRSSAQKFVRA